MSVSAKLRLSSSVASRVLPAPPGPMSVTSRDWRISAGELGELAVPADEAGPGNGQRVSCDSGADASAVRAAGADLAGRG